MPVPYYLKPKDTVPVAGHDDSLDPALEPVDAETRGVAPTDWAAVDLSRGGKGPPDAPLAPPGIDPAARSVPAFVWPREATGYVPNRSLRETIGPIPALDPDIAMWPAVVFSIWPFHGPPTEGIWPVGWTGSDSTGQLYVCTTAGEPGTWTPVGFTSAGVASFDGRTGVVVFTAADAERIFSAAGQLLAGTGSGTGDLLAKGSAGQVLTVGGADPSGLEWATPGVDSGWVSMSLANSWMAANVARYRKLNGVVFVEVGVIGGSGNPVSTLPAGFRPAGNDITTVVLVSNSGTAGAGIMSVDGDGTVNLANFDASIPTAGENMAASFIADA